MVASGNLISLGVSHQWVWPLLAACLAHFLCGCLLARCHVLQLGLLSRELSLRAPPYLSTLQVGVAAGGGVRAAVSDAVRHVAGLVGAGHPGGVGLEAGGVGRRGGEGLGVAVGHHGEGGGSEGAGEGSMCAVHCCFLGCVRGMATCTDSRLDHCFADRPLVRCKVAPLGMAAKTYYETSDQGQHTDQESQVVCLACANAHPQQLSTPCRRR